MTFLLRSALALAAIGLMGCGASRPRRASTTLVSVPQPEGEVQALLRLSPEDRTFVQKSLAAGHVVFFERRNARLEIARGCTVRAAYVTEAAELQDQTLAARAIKRATGRSGPDVALDVDHIEQLAAFESNVLAPGPCESVEWAASAFIVGAVLVHSARREASATSGGTETIKLGELPCWDESCLAVLAAQLVPIERATSGVLFPKANRVSYTNAASGSWSVRGDTGEALCKLPCSTWVLPGVRVPLREDTAPVSQQSRWVDASPRVSTTPYVGLCNRPRPEMSTGVGVTMLVAAGALAAASAALTVHVARGGGDLSGGERAAALILIPLFGVGASLGIGAIAINGMTPKDVVVADPSCARPEAAR